MRTLFITIIHSLLLLLSPGFLFAEGAPSQQTTSAEVATIPVQGMTCGACENTIRRALTAVEGVQEANADHQTGSVTVTFDSSKITREKLEQVIAAQGYTVATK